MEVFLGPPSERAINYCKSLFPQVKLELASGSSGKFLINGRETSTDNIKVYHCAI